MKNIISLQNSVINKLFKSGYGFHNYPKDLKYIKKINSKILKKNIIQPFFKDNSYQKKILIQLPSKLVKKTPSLFWKSVVDLKDIEDQASAHRWIWAYELLNSDFYDKKEKFKAINCLVNNWFYFFGNKKIDKNNVMHESYTISERLTNYVILLKLGFIKKK